MSPKRNLLAPKHVVEKMFMKFNKKYFGGELPIPEVRIIPAGQAGETLGHTAWASVAEWSDGWVLEIRALDLQVDKSYLAATLLHEMAHVNLFSHGVMHDNRSKAWKKEILRLSAAGALWEAV